MNMSERGVVIDIGGGGGEGILRDADAHPEMLFYVVDQAPCVIQPRYDNVRFIDQYVDVDTSLPFPGKTADVVKLFFLMGEVSSKQLNPNRNNEIALYKLIVLEAKRVLKDDGVIQITEVKDNILAAKTAFYEKGFYIFSPPVMAQRGSSRFTDVFFELYDHSGFNEQESHILPMFFEMKKCIIPGFYGY